jgi:hypothetical protein
MGNIGEYDKKKLILNGYDLGMIARTQPQGNVKVHSGYIEMGNCFVTFLNVYKFPKNQLPFFWLAPIVNQDGVIATLSIGTENAAEIKPDIDRALGELYSRINDDKIMPTDQMQAVQDQQQLFELYNNMYSSSETLKKIFLRLMVYDTTHEGLFKHVEAIIENYYAFSMARFIDEQPYELQSLWMPISEQERLPNKRKGKLIESYDLGGSYPFDYINCIDEGGTYFGHTLTNGAFIFNPYRLSGKRTRAFSLVAGNSGMGKSTFLQMLNDDAFDRGNFICNFDVTGEYIESTKKQNGVIINTASEGNRVNMFEIFPTVTDADGNISEIGSFNQNVNKIKTVAHIMEPSLTPHDLNLLDNLLIDFYIKEEMWTENPKHNSEKIKVLGLPHEQYPTLEGFIIFLEWEQDSIKNNLSSDQQQITSINNIVQTFKKMQSKHSDIFDGFTNIPDLSKEKVITFDMSGVKAISSGSTSESLFQAQFFSYLSLISSNVLLNGKKYRSRIKNGELHDDNLSFNIDYYYINIDEAEDYFKVNFPDVVNMLANMMEQMRKNYCAITLAFPTLKDIYIDNSTTTKYEEYSMAVNKIFGLFQYFHFFNLPSNDITSLKKYFEKNSSVSIEQLDTLQELEKGDILTIISGERSYRWQTDITQKQFETYR